MPRNKFTSEKAKEAGKKSKRGKSEKNKQWDEWGEMITSKGVERAMKIMEESEDNKFFDRFLQILEYFKPKLNRTTLEDNNGDNPFATLMKVQIVKSEHDLGKK